MNTQLVFVLVLLSLPAFGQDVIVNPDGTHSVRQGSVIVNSNGTHSTVHKAGKNAIIVGPEGTHTILRNRRDRSGGRRAKTDSTGKRPN